MREFYNPDGSKPKAIGKLPINNIQDIAFNRFNSGCENCGQQDYFLLHKQKVPTDSTIGDIYSSASSSMFSFEKRYYISCPDCNYVLELDHKEYSNAKKCLF